MRGIDISKHNTIRSFPALKAEGIEFCIVRAGYGTSVDPKFAAYIKAAKDCGMLVGAYWFCYALDVAEARREAEVCAETLRGHQLDLPVFYDFEYDTERYAEKHKIAYNPKLRSDIIETFCTEMTKRGYKAGVYTNPDYWLYKLDRARLKDYPLWIAAYVQSDCKASFGTTSPADLPPAYKNAMIWQFGMCKFTKAIGDVDINYGYGIKPAAAKKTYKVGDTYTVKAGDVYTTGRKVPARVVGKTYTIKQVRSGAILLSEINSWVAV